MKVLIATPAYDGKLHSMFVECRNATIGLAAQEDIECHALSRIHESIIQRARNDLLADAFYGEYDGLLWADSDVLWNPEWVVAMFKSEADCVGLPVAKKADAFSSNVKATKEQIDAYNGVGMMEVDSVGTGLLYLSRKAIAALWEQGEKYIDEGTQREQSWVYDVRPSNGVLVSEDVRANLSLREKGFSVMTVPQFTCAHIGNKTYGGNFAELLKEIKSQENTEADEKITNSA